jgi:hypothetical protein
MALTQKQAIFFFFFLLFMTDFVFYLNAQTPAHAKEIEKQFSKDKKRYEALNDILIAVKTNSPEVTLKKMAELCEVLNSESQEELERILVKETGERWTFLASRLRYECEKCHKKRELTCPECHGSGKISKRMGIATKELDCKPCKSKGKVVCEDCFWRFNSREGKKVEDYFALKKKNNKYDSKSISTINGEIRWGGKLCPEAKVSLCKAELVESYLKSGDSLGSTSSYDVKKVETKPGYFSFKAVQGEYCLVFWKEDYYFVQQIEVANNIVTIPPLNLLSSIIFATPQNNDEVLSKPASFEWNKSHEEFFFARLFEITTKKEVLQFKPISVLFTAEPKITLNALEKGEKYMLIVSGYLGNKMMSTGKITFSIEK